MKPVNAHETDLEQESLDLDRKRFELEEMKFAYAKTIDEKKLRSDRSAKLWAQFSIFIPLMILLLGFFLNSYVERTKREQTQKEESVKSQRQFVEKQLAEFYYPIQLRLHKDDAFFDSWKKNKVGPNVKIAKKLEEYMLPNHEEIIKIIDAHFDLIKNESDDDRKDIDPLMDAMKAYEKHVAVLRALRETGDLRKPIALNEQYPKEFFALIEKRILDLEKQRDRLLPP